MQGTKWRGYCPFPALGHDTAGGVAIGAAWHTHGRRACAHGRAATCSVALATKRAHAHDTGVALKTCFPLP